MKDGLAASILLAVGLLAAECTGEVLALPVGLLVGAWWLSPDLDLQNSKPTKLWGPLGWLWWPYAKLFKHRGLSHHLLAGPASRLCYLYLFVAPIWRHFDFIGLDWWLAWAMCGVVLGNWVHLWGDGLLTPPETGSYT